MKTGRRPLGEDSFFESESKLKKVFDEKGERLKFQIIYLTNKSRNVKKEIRSHLTSKGIVVFSSDLSRKSYGEFTQEIESFITEKYSRTEESSTQSSKERVVLISGLGTLTQDRISDTLLSQWNQISDENHRFIILIDSESVFREIQSRFKSAEVQVGSLDIRDFSDRVKSHLGQFKRDVMMIKDKGEYWHKGKKYYYDYILPAGSEMKNILSYRGHQPEIVVEKIDLHRYYHHLNSSQIMCINFFYPLIKENLLNHVLRILDIDGEVDYFEFEKASEVEGVGYRKTMFDFYIKTKDGMNIYFEIKYTENGFGKAEDDKDHQRKFTVVYEPKLNQSEVINNEFKGRESFFENYQIIRNVININEDSYVVFLYPEENSGIRAGAKLARDKIINEKWKHHFKPITWEAISEEILCYIEENKELKNYYTDQFMRKYML